MTELERAAQKYVNSYRVPLHLSVEEERAWIFMKGAAWMLHEARKHTTVVNTDDGMHSLVDMELLESLTTEVPELEK